LPVKIPNGIIFKRFNLKRETTKAKPTIEQAVIGGIEVKNRTFPSAIAM
jgi:hypothetical protein